MNIETFLSLPTEEVAQIVHEAGPKVCVFPINGTRRWFMLEYPRMGENLKSGYLDITGRRYIDLYKLFFSHGVHTMLIPVFGPDLLDRGESYMRAIAEGMQRLTLHPDFLEFYRDYQVRVRFYGDYRKFLGSTPYAYLIESFAQITARTLAHNKYLLLYGVCAQDATETIAELAVKYYIEHHKVPDKFTLVELYYGEYIQPVDLFIGFDKFSAFDMPLVAMGQEDLYFTIAPSPYMSEEQLRRILYDHLYTRPEGETDYSDLESEDWRSMDEFYKVNQGKTFGVGMRRRQGSFWYPLPQVDLPDGF